MTMLILVCSHSIHQSGSMTSVRHIYQAVMAVRDTLLVVQCIDLKTDNLHR